MNKENVDVNVFVEFVALIDAKSKDQAAAQNKPVLKRSRASKTPTYNDMYHKFLNAYGHLFQSSKFCENLLNRVVEKSAQTNPVGATVNTLNLAQSIVDDVKKEFPEYRKFIEEFPKPRKAPKAIPHIKKIAASEVSNEILNDFSRLLKLKALAQKSPDNPKEAYSTDLDKHVFDRHLAEFVEKHSEFLLKNEFNELTDRILGNVPKTELGIKKIIPKIRSVIAAIREDYIALQKAEQLPKDFIHLVQLHISSSRSYSAHQQYAKALDEFVKKHSGVTDSEIEKASKVTVETLSKSGIQWTKTANSKTQISIEGVQNDFNNLLQKYAGPKH